MAWYCGTYSCGHEGRTNIVGPTKDRQWKADRHFEGLCSECYEKKKQEEREAANREAAEKSAEMELPELTGTEKQIVWANTLRVAFISEVERQIKDVEEMLERKMQKIKEGQAKGLKVGKPEDIELYAQDRNMNSFQTTKQELSDMLDYALKTHVDAKFWIDSRNDGALICKLVSEYREHAKEIETPDEVKEEIQEEIIRLTVTPECEEKKPGVAVIELDAADSMLKAKYVKDNDFIDAVKELGYKWTGAAWKKNITEYTGNAEERAAELGNKLLASGFTVQFPNAAAKDMSISGSYSPENDRWIKYNLEDGRLAIRWTKRSDTLYNAAKKLPGAQWRGGAMLVGMEFYREVQDFADTMGFSISQKAKAVIEKYKKIEFGFETADVKTHDQEVVSDEQRIAKALKSDGTIIEDLIDE